MAFSYRLTAWSTASSSLIHSLTIFCHAQWWHERIPKLLGEEVADVARSVCYGIRPPAAWGQPTLFLDLIPAPEGTAVPEGIQLPERPVLERVLIQEKLNDFLAEVREERERTISVAG